MAGQQGQSTLFARWFFIWNAIGYKIYFLPVFLVWHAIGEKIFPFLVWHAIREIIPYYPMVICLVLYLRAVQIYNKMLTVSSPYRMPRRCLTCCRGLPEWDTHFQCSQHRECSKLHPCAACSLWTAPTWALSEAWLKAHPPFQRAPALVPSAVPTDTSVTPAPPEEASPGPPLTYTRLGTATRSRAKRRPARGAHQEQRAGHCR